MVMKASHEQESSEWGWRERVRSPIFVSFIVFGALLGGAGMLVTRVPLVICVLAAVAWAGLFALVGRFSAS